MFAKPALLIGLGAFAGHTLDRTKVCLRDAYNGDSLAVEVLRFYFNRQSASSIHVAGEAVHTQVVHLDDDLGDWMGGVNPPDLPFTQYWCLLDRRSKSQTAQQTKRRQFMRLVFLYHLLTPSSRVLHALQRAVKRLEPYGDDIDVHFVGALIDPEMSAWYFDLANLVRYVLAQQGQEAHFLLHLVLPDVTENLNARTSSLNSQTFIFFQEMEHFIHQGDYKPLPLYPFYMEPFCRFNTNRPLCDLLLLYTGGTDSDVAVRRDTAAQQITDGILPLLDNHAGAKSLDYLLTNRDAQRVARQHVGITAALVRSSSLHLPVGELRQHWATRLAVESFHRQVTPEPAQWQAAYHDLMQGASYDNPFDSGQTAIPSLLTNLYITYRQHTALNTAADSLRTLSVGALDQAFVDLVDSTILDSHRSYSQNQVGGLYIQAVVRWFQTVFVSIEEPPRYPEILTVRLNTRYDDRALTAALCGVAAYCQRTYSIETALQVMRQMDGDFRQIGELVEDAHRQLKQPDMLLNELQLLGRKGCKLRERRFSIRDKLAWDTQRFLDGARQLCADAERYYLFLAAQQFLSRCHTVIEQITAALTRTHRLIWGDPQAFVRHIRVTASPSLPAPLKLSQQWVDDYYEAIIRPAGQHLQGVLDWQWRRSQDGSIVRLDYRINGQSIEDGAQAARQWLTDATRLATEASAELRLWEAWHEADQPMREGELAVHLTRQPDFPAYQQPSPPPVPAAALYIAHPRIDSADYVAAKKRLHEQMPTTYPLPAPVDVPVYTYVIYHQMLQQMLLEAIQTYQVSQQAYHNHTANSHTQDYILPAEVQAAQWGIEPGLLVVARSLLAYPDALQIALELLVLDLIVVDDNNRYRIDTPLLNEAFAYLTPVNAVPRLRDVFHTLVRFSADPMAWQDIIQYVSEQREAGIDAVLGQTQPFSHSHSKLWQSLRDLDGLITDLHDYERQAVLAQMVADYRKRIENEPTDEVAIKALILHLADHHVDAVIDRLRKAVFTR